MASLYKLKSLPALSPEVILEVVSHIGVGKLPPIRANEKARHTLPMGTLIKDDRKSTIANLRLVCRYLSQVLEHVVFKSIAFDFGGINISEEYVKFRLLWPLNGGSAAAFRHTTQITIKYLSKDSRSCGAIDGGENVVNGILSTHLKETIHLFHGLRFVS